MILSFFIEVLNSKNVKVYWERKEKADVTGANQLAFDGIPYVHMVVTRMDTPKSGIRAETGTE